MESPYRHAHETVGDEDGLPRLWCVAGDIDNFLKRRARCKADGATKIAAAATHMAITAALHRADGDQGRAIDRLLFFMSGLLRLHPGRMIDMKMDRREFRQKPENAIDRAHIAAPNALILSIKVANDEGSEGRAAKDQQNRFWVLVDAGHLAIDRGADEGEEGPTFPGEPTGDGQASPKMADGFGQRAFGTKYSAPGAPDEDHAEKHEGPPNAPEGKLRKNRQIVPNMRGPLG